MESSQGAQRGGQSAQRRRRAVTQYTASSGPAGNGGTTTEEEEATKGRLREGRGGGEYKDTLPASTWTAQYGGADKRRGWAVQAE